MSRVLLIILDSLPHIVGVGTQNTQSDPKEGFGSADIASWHVVQAPNFWPAARILSRTARQRSKYPLPAVATAGFVLE